MSKIIGIEPLGLHWNVEDPFLFCAHHKDLYPEGTETLGPDRSVFKGRDMGQDFVQKDGFRMYHGLKVPGFPAHPHRGFETVTVVREGLLDHADSFGGAARYGNGDVQWLTAGKGIQHSEMFPLLNRLDKNPFELFQIWLNLPAKSKFAEPHYSMFWAHEVPIYEEQVEGSNQKIRVRVTAGELNGTKALTPPPESYAAAKDSQVAIWEIEIPAGASFTLPAGPKESLRNLFFYDGKSALFDGESLDAGYRLKIESDVSIEITAKEETAYFLLLQGKPIGEPVMQYGPFVMNNREEITQAINDYQRTKFGGWPWKSHDATHGNDAKRFAVFPDGRREEP